MTRAPRKTPSKAGRKPAATARTAGDSESASAAAEAQNAAAKAGATAGGAASATPADAQGASPESNVGGAPANSADAPSTSSPGASAQASSTQTLEEAAGNGDGTYNGVRLFSWLSEALGLKLSETEIRATFEAAKSRQDAGEEPEGWTLDTPIVRIVSKQDGFRRARLAHPKAPTDHPGERFSKVDLVAIVGDPMLSASLVMPNGEVVPLTLEGGALKLKPPAEAKE